MSTLADVAREAGVSKATASRAMMRPDMVAASTLERVRAAAERLGFQPNRAARALTTGRTGMLGLIVPTLANPFFSPLVLGAQRAAEETDNHLLIGVSEYDAARESALAGRLCEQADGLVMVAPVGSDASLRAQASHRPLVLVDRRVGRLPAVVLDTSAGTAALVQHLCAFGHREIAYVSGPAGSWADAERRTAATEQAEADGGRLHILGPLDPTFDAGVAAARQLPPSVTGVVAYNSYLALGLLHGLTAAGIHVPRDLSLAAADDLNALGATDPPVTALDVPVEEAGALAVARLLEVHAGTRRTVTTRLPTHVLPRGSTAPPPGTAARTPHGAGHGA
ncbi:LacI family DNA-binding transcriptional regulator [Streptomyces iconiensis]|uniref:LacI family DNA-binding transcriptional regulator n=1 Tax=Streptomyces iconiensis TaxID=1384038 RepID=A0ABT6ZR81_9ACTN|nr:LacI family DNA-binding transcriptional regulator [Streptomyces iconiensis]MDJ1131171.1 LacI family DNA-binding transcriptional regulator [Streptomyces iconiensis]